MKFEQPITVDWMAEFLGAKVEGNMSNHITGINEIHKVEKGDLVFVDHPKYYDKCIHSDADFIIINQSTSFPPNKTLFIVDQPFEAYLKIVHHFKPFTQTTSPVHPTLVVGEGSYIAPNVYIGKNVSIGKNCRILPNVTIMDDVQIGDDVVIQSGSVIGSDAFYYNTKKNRSVWYKRMESCGSVIIENFVEIGAGCTIDRGVTHSTIIGEGSKLDNMVHIGHDTIIGKNCLIAAQVGIAGATTLEDGVVLWGQVGVSKTLTIGENAVVLAQSGVPSSLAGNKTYFGYPAEEANNKKRELVWIKRIPQIWEKIKDKK